MGILLLAPLRGRAREGLRLGAGAVGGYLAGFLARGGAEVSVVARGAHLAAIRADGLRVETPDDALTVRVAASDDPAALGPQDVVLVTVKAPALADVAARIAPLLGPETAVAFVMNGIPWWYFHALGAPLGTPLGGRWDGERFRCSIRGTRWRGWSARNGRSAACSGRPARCRGPAWCGC